MIVAKVKFIVSFISKYNEKLDKMIIIWRYLLGQFLKVLVLSLVSFIAILLTTRLDDIAHFASLGSQGIYILQFTLHQIPYLLPIALPISCLLSALVLVQRLSSTQELTALRASGMPIRLIIAPILITAAYLSVFNFYIASELATNSHLATNVLKTELRSVNPLLLLHNKHMMRLKGIYFDTLGSSRMGESASDIIIAMPNRGNNRINLMTAKELQASSGFFTSEGLTFITSIKSDNQERFDHLMVENIGQTDTTTQDFAQILQKKVLTLNNDHLKLGMLLTRIGDEKKLLEEAKNKGLPSEELKNARRNINRGYTEIFRRLSIAIAVFTFTLMGISFGTTISRTHSNRGVLYVIGLAALYLVTYFTAKSLEYQAFTAATLYLAPHVIIAILSTITLWRVSNGVEK